MRINVYKQSGKLIPCTQIDKEKVDKMPVGEPFLITYKKHRNPEFLRKYWSLVNLFVENLPESFEKDLRKYQFRIMNKEDAHFYIKLKTGYIEKKFVDQKGNIGWFPKSIAFDKMDETEFEEFYSKALDVVCQVIGVEETEVMNQLMEYF